MPQRIIMNLLALFVCTALFLRVDGLSASKPPDIKGTEKAGASIPEVDRRSFLMASASGAIGASVLVSETESVNAFSLFGKKKSSDALPASPIEVDYDSLSSEYCLLKLLPVDNALFRGLQKRIEQVSALRLVNSDPSVWNQVQKSSQSALQFLDAQRGKFQRPFNPDDSAYMQIMKEEQFESKIENLRQEIVRLNNSTECELVDETYENQKRALLALADVGELLVEEFPYDVPEDGKYGNLPRLLGRCKVTFAFTRKNKPLGNVTVIADGFAAPLTAGNFIDLCLRKFYPGLEIVARKKNLAEAPIIEKIERRPSIIADTFATITDRFERVAEKDQLVEFLLLGSYQEGFISPLTGNLRRIPLEVVRLSDSVIPGNSKAGIVYSSSFANEDVIDDEIKGRPILSFDIPGLVALNHPDRFPNSGSSEFFSIPQRDIKPDKTKLMNGRYAPFGYIVDGFDVLQNLRPGDIIAANYVDEFGLNNLKRIRGSTLADLISGDDDSEP